MTPRQQPVFTNQLHLEGVAPHELALHSLNSNLKPFSLVHSSAFNFTLKGLPHTNSPCEV